MIEEALYRSIVKCLPIACVDVVLRVPGGVLLLKRGDEPLRGEWWVIGGRIHMGEGARSAAARKVRQEVGVDIDEADLRFLGYYEDEFERSAFGEGPYQTLSLVFEAQLKSLPGVTLDRHSEAWVVRESFPERLRVVRPTVESEDN